MLFRSPVKTVREIQIPEKKIPPVKTPDTLAQMIPPTSIPTVPTMGDQSPATSIGGADILPGYDTATGRSNTSMAPANITDDEYDILQNDSTLDQCAEICNKYSDCRGIYRYRYNNKWGCDLKTSGDLTVNVGPQQKFYIKRK